MGLWEKFINRTYIRNNGKVEITHLPFFHS